MHDQKPKAVIWDLDGTLSDDRARAHFVEVRAGRKPDWDAYEDASDVDPPIAATIEILRALRARGLHVALLTGRPERTRAGTERWLEANGLGDYDELRMPADGDVRPSADFKADVVGELRDRYEIVCAFEDLEDVAVSLRSAGIPVFLYAHAEDVAARTSTPEPASQPCPPMDGLP